jgi:hypothetical protein
MRVTTPLEALGGGSNVVDVILQLVQSVTAVPPARKFLLLRAVLTERSSARIAWRSVPGP